MFSWLQLYRVAPCCKLQREAVQACSQTETVHFEVQTAPVHECCDNSQHHWFIAVPNLCLHVDQWISAKAAKHDNGVASSLHSKSMQAKNRCSQPASNLHCLASGPARHTTACFSATHAVLQKCIPANPKKKTQMHPNAWPAQGLTQTSPGTPLPTQRSS